VQSDDIGTVEAVASAHRELEIRDRTSELNLNLAGLLAIVWWVLFPKHTGDL